MTMGDAAQGCAEVPVNPPPGRAARWFAVALAHAVAIPTAAVQVRLLWQWFAVPAGAPPVGVAHAFGLALLAAAMSPAPTGPTTLRREVTGRLARAAQRVVLGFVAHGVMAGRWW